MHIPFATLAQRHLVYAYIAVAAIHTAYAAWLIAAFRKTRQV